MKKITFLIILGIIITLPFTGFSQKSIEKSAQVTGQYIVIAWNDLGMHCANLDFSNMCILPPYNNQKAQVIKVGSPSSLPLVMSASSGIFVTYEIPGNTESATKTNFWNYAQQLFGVALPPNVGLTGFGMSGTMLSDANNYYGVEGIPITAFPDATPTVPDPYQLTLITAYSGTNELLATTQSVIPVAHEINCVSSGCHSSELAMLNKHDNVPGFNVNNRPIFCATCHSDNALGMPGQPGVPSFSQAIHEKHGGFINTGTNTDCYKCHPGPNTQCWRDAMHGSPGGITKCQDCHGSVSNVGHSIDQGREPWLEEPSCGSATCHGPNYAEEPGKLFRNSKGHGGLFCSACHGSPHAIFPSENPRDNVQNIALQGYAGTLSDCAVCHGYYPTGAGPHGILNNALQNVTVPAAQTSCYSATGVLQVAGNGTAFSVQSGGSATFIAGLKINFLPGTVANAGGYLHGYISTNGQYCGTPTAPLESAMGTANSILSQPKAYFKVYPNPTSGNFMAEIANPSLFGKIHAEIYNSRGEKLVIRESPDSRVQEFILENQPAGVYFVRLVCGDQTETVKLIRQ
jgi:hypothetical protein